jgi:hypothetical protein
LQIAAITKKLLMMRKQPLTDFQEDNKYNYGVPPLHWLVETILS